MPKAFLKKREPKALRMRRFIYTYISKFHMWESKPQQLTKSKRKYRPKASGLIKNPDAFFISEERRFFRNVYHCKVKHLQKAVISRKYAFVFCSLTKLPLNPYIAFAIHIGLSIRLSAYLLPHVLLFCSALKVRALKIRNFLKVIQCRQNNTHKMHDLQARPQALTV